MNKASWSQKPFFVVMVALKKDQVYLESRYLSGDRTSWRGLLVHCCDENSYRGSRVGHLLFSCFGPGSELAEDGHFSPVSFGRIYVLRLRAK